MTACWIHGNPIVAHALEMNPVDYVITSVIGIGLPDKEITVFFAKVVRGKIKAQETGTSFPLSAENSSAVVKMAIYIDFFN